MEGPAPSPNLFYNLVRWASIPSFALFFRLRHEGADGVPSSGPVLLAANHVSYLDPAVLGSACPRRVVFLMKSDVWAHWPSNWFYRGMGAIPVDRDATARSAIRAALAALGRGEAVGIFPQGARAGPESVGEGLGGVALLARRSGAPVVPVGIAGTEIAMPRGKSVPEPVRIHLAFGQPVRHGEGARSGDADAAFTRDVMERIGALVGEARAARQRA